MIFEQKVSEIIIPNILLSLILYNIPVAALYFYRRITYIPNRYIEVFNNYKYISFS